MTRLSPDDLATLLRLAGDQRALTAGQRTSLSQERDSAATRNLRWALDAQIKTLDTLIEKLEAMHREQISPDGDGGRDGAARQDQ
jgi:hypothetical protein